MLRSLLHISAALLLAGCAARSARVTPPSTGMQTTMQRQVANAIDAGDGNLEIVRLRQLVAANPSDVEARWNLAAAYRDLGAPEVALEHIRAARLKQPAAARLVLEEASLLHSLRLPAEAISTLSAYTQAYPDSDAGVFSWLGIYQDEAGNHTEGEASHRASVEKAPTVALYHNNLGYNLLQQGRFDDAARVLEAALQLDRSSEVARNNLAQALASRPAADPRGALGHWLSLGDAAAAHNNLAAVYIRQGKYPEARAELEKALAYNHSFGPALRNLDLVSQLDGRPAEIRALNAPSRWQLFSAGLKRIFITTEEAPPRRASR